MPNCHLPLYGDIHLSMDESDENIFEYEFEHAGANRDFVRVVGQSWGIKFELGQNKDHCMNEMMLYNALPELRKRVPRCFGFVSFHYEEREIHALMVERVAFTMDAILTEIRMSNYRFESEMLLAHLVELLVLSHNNLNLYQTLPTLLHFARHLPIRQSLYL